MGEDLFLIVGLGNPGLEYAATRHNAGFMMVDELAGRFGVLIDHEKWQAYHTLISRWGSRICLIKPDTFMNLSGKAVARYAVFYKVQPQQIIVVHDDLDMVPGRIKLVVGGGAGGHNGIRSMVQCLGTTDFLRLKVGIGRPERIGVSAGIPIEKYVLAPFSLDEKELLIQKIDFLEQGLECLIRDGVARAMNLLNVRKS